MMVQGWPSTLQLSSSSLILILMHELGLQVQQVLQQAAADDPEDANGNSNLKWEIVALCGGQTMTKTMKQHSHGHTSPMAEPWNQASILVATPDTCYMSWKSSNHHHHCFHHLILCIAHPNCFG